MENEVLDRVKGRKNFYRDYYRRAYNLLWFALSIIVVLSFLNIYLYITRPMPDFYATSSDGKLVKLNSMEAPNYSNTSLIP